jgi:hypothetical protein
MTMRTKTTRRGSVQRLDANRPTKTDAPASGTRVTAAASETTPPSYSGPAKTDKAPRARAGTRRTGTAKPRVSPEATRRPRARADQPERADQVAKPVRRRRGGAAAAAEGAGPEQYIRMRIRVRGDRLSVVDSHLVEGPLAQTTTFMGANAYEVSVDDRLLHAGGLPDLGVQRSFVNPDGPPEQRGHHITERSVYEFNARVPAHEVTPETIGRIAVRLHRVKDQARTDRLGSAPLAAQFERQVRPVAELVGLPASVLPEAIDERGARTPAMPR